GDRRNPGSEEHDRTADAVRVGQRAGHQSQSLTPEPFRGTNEGEGQVQATEAGAHLGRDEAVVGHAGARAERLAEYQPAFKVRVSKLLQQRIDIRRPAPHPWSRYSEFIYVQVHSHASRAPRKGWTSASIQAGRQIPWRKMVHI